MSFLINSFQVPFMQRALVAVLLIGVLAGTTGVLVVLRRLAFLADALTHTIFPGIVIAFLTGHSLLLGALAFGLLSALLLSGLTTRRGVGQDAALAILLTSFFAVGVALVSRSRGYTADLAGLLFGRVLAIQPADLVQMAVVAAVVLLTLAALRKELLLRAFDPEGSAALGYSTAVLDLILNLAVALVVVMAVKAVGTVLVIAMLVVPAATARLVTDRVAAMTAVSVALGAIAGWLGLAVSYQASIEWDVSLAAGATVVVLLVCFFLLALGTSALARRPR
jgi:manganese/iron transport system permease protein